MGYHPSVVLHQLPHLLPGRLLHNLLVQYNFESRAIIDQVMLISFCTLRSSTSTVLPVEHPMQANLPVCTQSSIIQKLKENVNKNILIQRKAQLAEPFSSYCEKPLNLLKWIQADLQESRSRGAPAIKRMVDQINKTPSNQIQMSIIEQIRSQESYLCGIMKKGFLPYLFSKYQTHNNTDNARFVEQFTKDINWFKVYFTNLILDVYAHRLEDIEEVRKYFESRAVVYVLTLFPQWKIIYAIFNKCMGKQTYERCREEMEKQFEDITRQYREETPFSKSIEVLKKFCEEHILQQKTQLLLKLSDVLKQQMNPQNRQEPPKRNPRRSELNQRKKLTCLEYCVFKSGKESLKSVIYLEILLGADNLHPLCKFQNQNAKFELKSLKDATITLLSGQTVLSYDYCLTNHPRQISFRMPTVKRTTSLPFQMESITHQQTFTTLNNPRLTLFSVQPLVVGSSITLEFSPNAQNDLSIGVCNKSAISERRKSIQKCESVMMLNTKSKMLYERCVPSDCPINERVSRVTFRVKDDKEVQWIINDDGRSSSENIVSVAREYAREAREQKELYACVSFRNKTQFRIVDY